MIVSLASVLTWQRLRLLARGKNKPLTGRVLRCGMDRMSKDGTFLDKLVDEGLLDMVESGVRPPPQRGIPNRWPVQFFALYRLTPLGLHASEFGEYERAPRTASPITTKGKEK